MSVVAGGSAGLPAIAAIGSSGSGNSSSGNMKVYASGVYASGIMDHKTSERPPPRVYKRTVNANVVLTHTKQTTHAKNLGKPKAGFRPAPTQSSLAEAQQLLIKSLHEKTDWWSCKVCTLQNPLSTIWCDGKEKKVCDCCPLRPQHAPWNPNSGEKKTRACTFCHPKMCDCWLCPECLKYNPFADTICGGCKVRGASFADSSATSQQGKDAPKVRKDRWFDNWCEKTEDDVWWISDLPQIECNLCTSQKCLCWECPHCFKKNRYGNTCIHCHVCKTDWKCQCKSKFWRAQDTIVCIRCTTTNPKHVTRKTLFGKPIPKNKCPKCLRVNGCACWACPQCAYWNREYNIMCYRCQSDE